MNFPCRSGLNYFSLFAGVCPSGEWKSFQSRCFYNPNLLKLSYAGAMSACRKEGAELAWPDRRVITKVEQEFIVYGIFGSYHGQASYWSGMKNRTFEVKNSEWKFLNKPCGAYRSLLYFSHGPRSALSCAAPRHFVCELEKGKSDVENMLTQQV